MMVVAVEQNAPPRLPLPVTQALQWLASHGDSLFAYALRRVRRREVAEDLVQETLLAGMQAWDQFSNRSNVKTWLTGILRNKIADHFRARYRDEMIRECDLDDQALFNSRGKWKVSVPRWNGDPHQLAEQKELKQVISSCMSKLPARMAHLFLSRVADENSTAELCKELEISADNAWVLMHRARLRLRQCLTINWFSEQNSKAK